MVFDRETIVKTLKTDTPKITFTKADDSERVMHCTLMDELLPALVIKEGAKKQKENLEIIKVFDLEVKQWRSFRVDSVKRVETDTLITESVK